MGTRTAWERYWKLESIVAPNLAYSQLQYEEVLRALNGRNTRWLDIGCGHQVLPSWREQEERRLVENCAMVVGLDCDLPSLQRHRSITCRALGDAKALPFADGAFDLVTANMVVEHLDQPSVQFQEIARVLAPGGVFLFHTPNALGYPCIAARMVPEAIKRRLVRALDGREDSDIFRTYYRANTRRAIARLAASSGLEVAELRMMVTNATFALIPILALPELVWIRVLMTRPLRPLRTNIIGVLQKQPAGRRAIPMGRG